MKTIRLAIAAMALAALPAAASTADRDRSGAEIVKSQCAKCHETGVKGAPRIDDRAAWSQRMKNGLDATVRSAIRGHGAMPARGGLADLTDAELRAAILYLFNPAGTTAKPRAPAPAPRADSNVKRVAGVEIRLGVTSAKALRARKTRSAAETTMHGGIPTGDDQYHVNISLRDEKTQKPIADAQVEASIADPMMGGETRQLEPMKIGSAVSYGNYFRMTGKGSAAITVRISRPGSPQPIEARFDYKS